MLDQDRTNSPIILALDYEQKHLALELVQKMDPRFCRLKVGPVLFTRYGPVFIEELIGMGFSVFLDLKFHDIPQTVYGAIKAAADMGVWMVNVHVAGGRKMMEAAREAVEKSKNQPILLGVTVLTSLEKTDLEQIGIKNSVDEEVKCMSRFAEDCGLDGVVCSAGEASMLRKTIGDNFILVTPGIRLPNDPPADQKRVRTPAEAFEAGSNYIVVGRSVTLAQDPLMVLEKIYLSLS